LSRAVCDADGNRKGHRDPDLRKLVCFGEEVWRELRGLMKGKKLGGDEVERRPVVPEAVPVDPEERAEDFEVSGTSIEIDLPEELLSWWKVERWEEIFDERLLYDDLSHEGKRTLRKLLS
jgi:hypothetical protein